MFKLSNRSAMRMIGVHPLLMACVCLALKKYTKQDFGVGIGAVRTPEEQKVLVEKGVSKTLKSKHLIQPDGFSHAVDLYPSGFQTVESMPDSAFLNIKKAMEFAAHDLGLRLECGYDWGWDKPHYEIERFL